MHGLEKTKIVAQSLRGAADWIENVCREVRGKCGLQMVKKDSLRRVGQALRCELSSCTGSVLPLQAASAECRQLTQCVLAMQTRFQCTQEGIECKFKRVDG